MTQLKKSSEEKNNKVTKCKPKYIFTLQNVNDEFYKVVMIY